MKSRKVFVVVLLSQLEMKSLVSVNFNAIFLSKKHADIRFIQTLCSYIYEPSSTVKRFISLLDEQRCSLLELQEKYDVKVSY